MHKKNILSILRPLVVIGCSVSLFSVVPAQATQGVPHNTAGFKYVLEERQVDMLRYVGLVEFSANLDINSNGYASCVADIRADLGYTCDATLELQKKSGSSWSKVKTWSSSGRVNSFDEGRYVVKGSYRLKASARVFDPSGNCVEDRTTYSTTVTY